MAREPGNQKAASEVGGTETKSSYQKLINLHLLVACFKAASTSLGEIRNTLGETKVKTLERYVKPSREWATQVLDCYTFAEQSCFSNIITQEKSHGVNSISETPKCTTMMGEIPGEDCREKTSSLMMVSLGLAHQNSLQRCKPSPIHREPFLCASLK